MAKQKVIDVGKVQISLREGNNVRFVNGRNKAFILSSYSPLKYLKCYKKKLLNCDKANLPFKGPKTEIRKNKTTFWGKFTLVDKKVHTNPSFSRKFS